MKDEMSVSGYWYIKWILKINTFDELRKVSWISSLFIF